jgi:hypothetical protein
MTANEKLRRVVDELSEPETEATLAFIAGRDRRDPVIDLFESARKDYESSSP